MLSKRHIRSLERVGTKYQILNTTQLRAFSALQAIGCHGNGLHFRDTGNAAALFRRQAGSGASIASLAHYYCTEEEYQKIFDVLMELIPYDSNFCYCIGLIVKLFSLLKTNDQPVPPQIQVGKRFRNIDLHKLIRWTQDNLSHHITLQDVADQFGYSKCYFCSRFKEMTGFTYYEYLTSARISYACQLLLLNHSVQETCYMAGFENTSYFIQLFKKYQGMTPKEYARAFAYTDVGEMPFLASINKNPD